MTLDRDGARWPRSKTRIGAPLGLGPEQAAEGILAVANSNMAAAIKLSLFEKGLDPRDFALVSFGGAGGLHATALADELGIAARRLPARSRHAVGLRHPVLRHHRMTSRARGCCRPCRTRCRR